MAVRVSTGCYARINITKRDQSMDVEAHVFYWTPDGMRESVAFPCQRSETAYITKREAERLLEEAHARGVAAARRVVEETL